MPSKYQDIILEITGQIGVIKLNRPKSLNAFGGKLMQETISAIRELNEHPDTVFTVLTGEGRFFSAGADVRGSGLETSENYASKAEKKIAYLAMSAPAIEMLRSIIDHTKIFVLALNGPGVGGGAAWFTGVSDIVLASSSAYLQVPFSALGLVPENGSAINFSQSMGVHRTNEFLMFGKKLSAQELEQYGMVNRVFESKGEDFQKQVREYLEEQLSVNDGKSMMEMKRLQNAPLRDGRLVAVWNSMDALAERFVDGAPYRRFEIKKRELEAKSMSRASKI
ncbi:peroxisomal d3,d2-enoyl-CoA isomeras-like protein [Hyaloscypha bicolor E]|uniref:Peroxisomal d3,d2-enoyl-CoA isomeras-like protein n=1 Tax=Hyaloscypha bicolor E TaxID=1095630 RepID=A0A2J6TQZ2_9HELO|nr:peroxisomal d3,d2-enoyl-CoA isomeras-like protein [Hyaloscypha bicolor E]PMD65447.1 peroxisomal d3,d2-enoyl-CoA isomeras-like protein [Hyaloscypha bicolor E]